MDYVHQKTGYLDAFKNIATKNKAVRQEKKTYWRVFLVMVPLWLTPYVVDIRPSYWGIKISE